jgi:hypothetical protein
MELGFCRSMQAWTVSNTKNKSGSTPILSVLSMDGYARFLQKPMRNSRDNTYIRMFFFPISLDGISMLLLGAPSTIVVLRFNFNLGDALQCYEDDDLILILVLTQPRGEQNRP